MIDLALIAIAGVLYWAWKTRDPQAMRISDVLAVIAALVGIKMLDSHSPLGVLGLGAQGVFDDHDVLQVEQVGVLQRGDDGAGRVDQPTAVAVAVGEHGEGAAGGEVGGDRSRGLFVQPAAAQIQHDELRAPLRSACAFRGGVGR